MAIRMQITPEDFKRGKLVKPGWWPTFIKDVSLELSAKKDSNNIVLDLENADKDSEFYGVPCKTWFSEKGMYFPGGGAAFCKAFDPKMEEDKVHDIDFEQYKGRYIYAKWYTFRGKDGQDPPQNRIEDWAPLPKKYSDLAKAAVQTEVAEGVGFDRV
jgi:hypothetical protein